MLSATTLAGARLNLTPGWRTHFATTYVTDKFGLNDAIPMLESVRTRTGLLSPHGDEPEWQSKSLATAAFIRAPDDSYIGEIEPSISQKSFPAYNVLEGQGA